MEMKLLHERLRELKLIEPGHCRTMRQQANLLANQLSCHPEQVFVALADEIEKYYLPRPRFEDGEPVQFGDSVKYQIGGVDVDRLDRIVFLANGSVDLCGTNDYYVHLSLNELAKRPESKVLDADGVEINVGDTVWNTIATPGRNYLVCHYTGELTVDHFNNYRPGFVIVRLSDGRTMDIMACHLTHKEPDSIEKLRDDIGSYLASVNVDEDDELVLFSKRLTAIMERDA